MFGKLLLLFIIVPIIELVLFLGLGEKLGLINTLAIIVITAVLGASLTKSQGSQALLSFQKALGAGKVPHREIVDGFLILIAGAVLLTPGFLTDAVGFLLLLPPARAVIRKVLADKLADHVKVSVGGNPLDADFNPPPEHEGGNAKPTRGKVIDV